MVLTSSISADHTQWYGIPICLLIVFSWSSYVVIKPSNQVNLTLYHLSKYPKDLQVSLTTVLSWLPSSLAWFILLTPLIVSCFTNILKKDTGEFNAQRWDIRITSPRWISDDGAINWLTFQHAIITPGRRLCCDDLKWNPTVAFSGLLWTFAKVWLLSVLTAVPAGVVYLQIASVWQFYLSSLLGKVMHQKQMASIIKSKYTKNAVHDLLPQSYRKNLTLGCFYYETNFMMIKFDHELRNKI